MHLIGIAITSFIAFVCYKSYLTLQKVNLREKYNIGKRASDDYTSTSTPSTEQLYANQPTDSTSGPGTGSKPSTRGNSGSSTTKSPIVLSSSALRNRLHGAPGRSPDYQSRDSSTPSRPLAKDNVQDILRQSSMFDSSNTSRTANFIYGSNTPSESPSHHQYNLSPLVAGPSSKPTPNTFRSIDALQALQLRQINDDWVERLRELLGRDLCKIVKL